MCGVAAIYPRQGAAGRKSSDTVEICRRMVERLRFRGPDEQSVVDADGCILGHARLSIIDLVTGSQPVYNEDRSVAVVLNGEIYNFLELRTELEAQGHAFATRSDTEVIAHLYEQHGDGLFEHLNGMFAIVIWDRARRRVVAGRDRMGEKPLLYADTPEGVIIASELKAILEHPAVARDVDREALALYFSAMDVPAPYTIFKGVRKLLPAHYMVVDREGLRTARYWTPRVTIDTKASVDEWTERIDALLAEAVRMRMVADVPLGVFLSGGVDSSAVTAYMAMASDRPVETFSVGFADDIDERPYARQVAQRYGTKHTEIFIERRLEDEVESVYDYMDEPFGDSSVVPTHLVAREARRHVKVAVTGDGGDELFAGYEGYLRQKYVRDSRLRTAVALAGKTVMTRAFGSNPFGDWLYPTSRSLRGFQSWQDVRTVFRDDGPLLRGGFSPTEFFRASLQFDTGARDPLSIAFQYDLTYYLPDDLLKKVDMAAMLASLECRAPFLDHRLVELSLSIPPQKKVHRDRLKYLLRRSLVKHLPPEILDRPKQGFGAPLEGWLRNRMRTLVQDVLARGCEAEQLIPRDVIDTALAAVYLPDAPAHSMSAYRLWLILALELWARRYLRSGSSWGTASVADGRTA